MNEKSEWGWGGQSLYFPLKDIFEQIICTYVHMCEGTY
jgi:hypothetical protein